LPVDFSFKDQDEKDHVERGFLYDYEKTFEFSSGSFFKDFIGQINQDLLDMDRIRFFRLNVDELLYGYSCVCELMLTDLVPSESVDQESGSRSFNLGGKYTLKVTLPILSKSYYLERIRIFLNGHSFYERTVDEVFMGKKSEQDSSDSGVVWENG
jgi:hypothetical protein